MEAKGMSHDSGMSGKAASNPRTGLTCLTKEELQRPGSAVLALLLREANARGQGLADMARELEVTYGYIVQLRNGARQVRHISPEFASACAAYLKLPRICVKIAAGQVDCGDFVWPARSEEEMLEAGLRRVQEDPLLGPHLPAAIFSASKDIQRWTLLCYQEASGHDVYPARQIPELMRYMHLAAGIEEEMRETSGKGGKRSVQR